jgi:hypothetical protein
MGKRGRPPKGLKFDDLPESLRFAIINMMSQYRIKDFDSAYDFAGMLLDKNGDEYSKAVQREAERLYRSRHFTELNKARATIEKTAFNSGYQRGEAAYRIWCFCIVCGKPIYITPDSDSHKTVIKLLRENNWGHISCRQKQS